MAGLGASSVVAPLTQRVWAEANCYVDLWIGLALSRDLDPHPMLFPALAVDFEGDQWTFLKPRHEDLRRLYGFEIEELQLWDGFERHVCQQLARGRVVLAEVDAFHLPDTQGVSHRREHVKTTIGIDRVDREQRRVDYFHNAGYFSASGDDFDGLMRPAFALPLFAEIVKLERMQRLDVAELRRLGRELCARDVARRPRTNPLREYLRCFDAHAAELRERDHEAFHRYAFATLRQCGAAFELGARCLRWLDPSLGTPACDLEAIAEAAKTALLKLARGVQRNKSLDLEPLAAAAPRWDAAFARLAEVV